MNQEERLLHLIEQQENKTEALILAINIIQEYYKAKEPKANTFSSLGVISY